MHYRWTQSLTRLSSLPLLWVEFGGLFTLNFHFVYQIFGLPNLKTALIRLSLCDSLEALRTPVSEPCRDSTPQVPHPYPIWYVYIRAN